jgi:hypothetical protein
MKNLFKNKKGFFDNLAALAIGIGVFAIAIVVVSVVLTNLGTAVGAGTANETAAYLVGKLGSGTGGLATWAPAVIALAIGVLFIGAIGSIWAKKKGGM